MKSRIFITIACLMAAFSAMAAEVPALQNVYGRQVQSLNGQWNYIVDVQEIGFYDYRFKESKWSWGLNQKPRNPADLVEYDFDKAPAMNIPSDWNTADPQLFFYEGTVWFKRNFKYAKKPGKRTLLYFGAVNYKSVVYLNGKKLGQHEGGFTAFSYDVTDEVRDGDNFIVVKVDNKRHADNVPTQIFDWWNYGGITRDVMLVEVDNTYIEDYRLNLSDNNTRMLAFSAKLNTAQAGVKVNLNIPELKIKKTFTTDANGTINATFKAKPQLWWPENPKLYKVILSQNQETINDEIGFRTIQTQGKKLLLNGKPIFLKGISIHEEKAYTAGRANSVADADTLLGWAQQLGCNFVRLAHYPHNEHMVRQAEKKGILVWSEIPVYWTISWDNPDTYNNAQKQLHDMILRDHNRANIIIWSIANETPHSAPRDKFLSSLAKYAKTQDNTRLISMAMEVTSASNYMNRLDDNLNEFVDVISFNQYIGWYRDVNDAPRMSWEIPYNKPVIISEMGGGAVAGLHGDKGQRWTEEFQENLYRQNFDMIDKIEGLAGTSPWILKDFMSPRRPLVGVQNWFNRKGLFSDQGQKKKAFWVVKEWYEKKGK